MVTLMVAFTVLYMIFTQEEDQYLVYSANIADVGHYSLNCYESLVGVSLFLDGSVLVLMYKRPAREC